MTTSFCHSRARPCTLRLLVLVLLWFLVCLQSALLLVFSVDERSIDRRQLRFVMPHHSTTAHRIKRQQGTQDHLLVHLHIGKNGGTSLDSLGRRLATETGRQFKGHAHFDWSAIESLPPKTTDVITMLRNPVNRAVSHYYFARTLSWTRGRPIRNMTLTEYLQDKAEMLQTRTIWFDGQAGVSWLTGTHVDSWVGGKMTAAKIAERELASENSTAICLLAADRLDQTFWFGIMEDLPRSMELLQHSLGLLRLPMLPKVNANRQSSPKPTVFEKASLASLMPRDLWLYEYGSRLFEARYQAMLTGTFLPPERPPFPKMWSCTSSQSRVELNCTEGPLKGFQRLATTRHL